MSQESMIPILNSREQACLQLIAEGKTNPEIADHMGLHESTIATILTGILAALNVERRIQAVSEGFRQGLIK